MAQVHIQTLFILALSIFFMMKLKQSSHYFHVQSHCEIGSYQTSLRQSPVMDCISCINLDTNRQIQGQIQIQTLNNENNQIWFGIWHQTDCFDFQCTDVFFNNDFYALQETNKPTLEKLSIEFKGKGITNKYIAYKSSFTEENSQDISINFLKLLVPIFQYFNINNYQYTPTLILRYRYNYIGSQEDIIKPQVKVYEETQSMEDAIFLSILVSFSVLLNKQSLLKSIILIFSFLSPILSSFMSLFFLSTRAHIYSLVLLIYAIGLGTNNKVISALVLVVVFINQMYRSSKIIENVTWFFFFILLSASFWLDIDALITYTPILLYGFIQIQSKKEDYHEINQSRTQHEQDREQMRHD